MARTLVLRPLAKINLTLHVGEARADGFHDVRTLLQSISLSDRLTLTSRPGPFTLGVRAAGVPDDRTNLVYRAAELLWRAAGRSGEPRDVHAKLEKQIPVAAGLGGGSADAAAALVGLNQIWNLGQSPRDLSVLAAGLGSDVPFFLQGGTALGVGRGEELYPVDDIRRLSVLLIKPSFGVSAGDAYRWLDEDRRLGADRAVEAVRQREVDLGWPGRAVILTNDLEAPVVRRYPQVREMVEACLRAGALGAAMTGSGSAVFGLFPDGVAARVAPRVQRPDWLVLAVRTSGRAEAGRRLGL